MSSCVVCLRSDRPMTREHVFARWLVRQVRGSRLVASEGSVDPAQPLRIARVVASVCAHCNAGWMSTLEVSFRQAVFARPRVGPLQAPDRLTIARWSTKTAVLLAHARAGVLLSDAQRVQLATGMPDGVEVYLARRRRPRQHLDFALDVVTGPDTGTLRSVAILVADVIAHVAQRSTLSGRHGTRLWPLRSHTIRWDTLPVIGGG